MTIAGRSDLEGMQRVGRLVAETLAFLTADVAPGITTAELDERGARFRRARGARPPLAAHYENTIVVRHRRPVVLTALAPQLG